MDTARIATRMRCTIWLVMLLAGLLFPAGARAAALVYDFHEPAARETAPPTVVYDWTTDRCGDDNDIPDQPARAFRNAADQVIVIATHHKVHRTVGTRLDNIVHECATVMTSPEDPDVTTWNHNTWLSSPYTADGTTVHGLSHMEYRGYKYDTTGTCSTTNDTWWKCWYNVLTLVKSTNGGASFSLAGPPPTHFVAGLPWRYEVGIGPFGLFNPSNIVRARDGYYYTLVQVEPYGPQARGACLMRTRDLSDQKSWRAWSGTGFTVRFLDPYVNNITNPAQHTCPPLGTIETGVESLTWNTYLKKWLLVRAGGGSGGTPSGFHMYTSDDLINWTYWTQMLTAELPWTHTCGEPDYLGFPSLLDPESRSRNFETTSQRPFLFFTHYNVAYWSGGCYMSFDRDFVRIPIELSNQQPGGPAATLSASTSTPAAGESVTFDASGSRDADGSIVRYQWDLDGDGTYERDTGTWAVTQTAYHAPDHVTVTVRVSDNDGKATDDTRVVRVRAAGNDSPVGVVAGRSESVAAMPAGATQAAVGRFRLLGKPLARAGGSLVLRVHAPAAGVLTVRGRGARAAIRPARATAAKAGKLVLRVRPSRAGKALLRKNRRARVKATFVFTPVGGALQRSTQVLTLGRAR